jgi:hypothetical protein
MCFSELLAELRHRGIRETESQIRWAIRSGKTSRPPMDSSLRFNFAEQHVDELENYFHETSTQATEM